MSACERCWAEAGGDHDEYRRRLKYNKCTPEDMAGSNATVCPNCGTRTRHQISRECMKCGQYPDEDES